MVSGIIGMLILFPVYTILTWLVWRKLARSPIAPVVLAFFANALLFYASEGVMGVQQPIAWFIAILITYRIYLWLTVKLKAGGCALHFSAMDREEYNGKKEVQ
jgi:hypothetical protein